MKKFMLAAGVFASFLSILELIDIILWHRMTAEEQFMYVVTRSHLFEEEVFFALLLLAVGLIVMTVSTCILIKKKK